MKIAVDAFGGDNAPLAMIQGAAMAVEELGVDIVLFGEEAKIKALIKEHNISDKNFSYYNTTQVVEQCDDPAQAIRTKKDSSMVAGLHYLKDGHADAFVSAGSSGALLVGATLIVKRIRGVKRGALAPVMPTDKGSTMLIDAGANTEVKPEYLYQFAVMGSIYMEEVMGIQKPKVGLLNIGAEESKGTQLQLDTLPLLKECPHINFAGNVEGRDVPLGAVDVVVCDGFSGNVLLKTYEGMGKMISQNLKSMFMSHKLAALMMMKDIKAFQKKMDYKETGGGIFMGICKPVIKAHGSSDARAFKNAIRQAKKVVDGDVIGKITEKLGKQQNEEQEG